MTSPEWEPIENVFPAGDEELQAACATTYRAKVPGGWRVRVGEHETFVPDPAHTWLEEPLAKH